MIALLVSLLAAWSRSLVLVFRVIEGIDAGTGSIVPVGLIRLATSPSVPTAPPVVGEATPVGGVPLESVVVSWCGGPIHWGVSGIFLFGCYPRTAERFNVTPFITIMTNRVLEEFTFLRVCQCLPKGWT